MIEVTFFGTAGATSYAERDNTYLGVRAGDHVFMVDCGGAPVHRARRFRFPWADIEAVFITHLHPDHCYGLPSLIHNMRLAERTAPLRIFCPGGDVESLKTLFKPFGFLDKPGYMPILFQPVELRMGEMLIEDDGVEVTAFPARHSVDCYGLRFRTSDPSKSLVYSSDTWRSESLMAAAYDADVLIHEASFLDVELHKARELGHATAGECGRIAKRCRVRRLAMVHFYRDQEEDVAAFAAEAMAEFGGEVVVPADGEVMEV